MAAANSSKGKKKVRLLVACVAVLRAPTPISLKVAEHTTVHAAEVVKGQDEGEGEQPSPL